jgi:multiple sugar transport system substrate-binding protein
MEQSLDAFKSGQVAMAMNWFAFFPGLYADPNVGGDKIDFFVNPARTSRPRPWAARASAVVAYTDNMDGALAYIKWFAQPDVQKKWWSMGGYSCHNAVLNDPGFKDSAPFAGDFLRPWPASRTSGRSRPMPRCCLAMQERLHNYIVADQGTAQEALDGLIADWTEVFEDEGKL